MSYRKQSSVFDIIYLSEEEDFAQPSSYPNQRHRITHCQREADKGNAFAQMCVARYYEESEFNRDMTKALAYYRLAAMGGNVLAIQRLTAYLKEDHCAAWYRPRILEAAEKGDELGGIILRNYSRSCNFWESSDSDGVLWLRSSANQGDPTSLPALGFCYWKGQGTPKNMVKALTCLIVNDWLRAGPNSIPREGWCAKLDKDATPEELSIALELSAVMFDEQAFDF